MNIKPIASILLLQALLLAAPADARRGGGGGGHSHSFGHASEAPHYSSPKPHEAGEGQNSIPGAAANMVGRAGGQYSANVNMGDGYYDGDSPNSQNRQSGRSSLLLGWILMPLTVAISVIVIRRRRRRDQEEREAAFSGMVLDLQIQNAALRSGAANGAASGVGVGTTVGSAAEPVAVGVALADGSDVTGFLRQTKASFMHLRTLNPALHGEEVRNYLSPELVEKIQPELRTNHEHIRISGLQAELEQSTRVGDQVNAVVRFHGSLRPSTHGPAFDFVEHWQFAKAGGPAAIWLVESITRS